MQIKGWFTIPASPHQVELNPIQAAGSDVAQRGKYCEPALIYTWLFVGVRLFCLFQSSRIVGIVELSFVLHLGMVGLLFQANYAPC